MNRVEDLVGHILVHGGTGQKFRVLNVENGDPRVAEINPDGLTAPRTISPRAVNRTFHHHQHNCPRLSVVGEIACEKSPSPCF